LFDALLAVFESNGIAPLLSSLRVITVTSNVFRRIVGVELMIEALQIVPMLLLRNYYHSLAMKKEEKDVGRTDVMAQFCHQVTIESH
jgi:hypothetical protein